MLKDACRTIKSTVHAAFEVLSDLTCTQLLPEEQVRDAMRGIAKIHGVHTLCYLFCPEVPPCHSEHEQAYFLAAQGGCCRQTAAGIPHYCYFYINVGKPFSIGTLLDA